MASGNKRYDDRNNGALFINDKGDNENRPDKTGKILIDPNDYPPNEDGLVLIYLAGWVRESERAGEYISLRASPPKVA